MIEALLILGGVVTAAFTLVVFFGAPYLPTLSRQTNIALELLDLRPGQHLIELGSGDGKVLIAAAEQGLFATGYELNPFLALFSWARTRKYRGRVNVVWGNFWVKKLPPTDGIFVFLLDKYMKKLDKKIIHNYPDQKIKLVSFAFEMPHKKHVKEEAGLFLYQY